MALEMDVDAVVLDLMPPGMLGWDFLARLRQCKGVPVLVLFALEGIEDRLRGLDGGVDDYFVKPLEPRERVARVPAIVRRAAGRATTIIGIGEVTVDTLRRAVVKDGEAIELTAQACRLVELPC